MIFDVCNVFNFFKLNPDGREDKTDGVLSLNQKIFMEKVALFKAMQSRYAMLTPEDKDMYVSLSEMDLLMRFLRLTETISGFKTILSMSRNTLILQIGKISINKNLQRLRNI